MERPWRTYLGLALIIGGGFGLRLWGIEFGLPNLYCRPDESTLVHKALGMGTGDLNPHFFNYPTLHFYLLAGLYGLYFAAGYLGGAFAGLGDFQRHYLLDPADFYLLGRLFSACLGTASVWLVYLLGRGLGGGRAGLLSAAFLSAAFLHVRDSHFLTVDVPATFHLLVACLFLCRYLDSRPLRHLLLGAAFLGLATSTKYSLGIFGISVVVAAVLGPVPEARWQRLVSALAVMGLAFAAGSPFALLDWPSFWQDLSYERMHLAAGHGLDLGRGWAYHLSFSLPRGLGWPLLIAGLGGCAWMGWRRRPADLVLLSGALGYYGVAGSGKAVFLRYVLPLIPLLCAAAALGVARLTRSWPAWGVALLGGAVLAPSASAAWQHDGLVARRDTRLLAAAWIEAHVPDGAVVAMRGSEYGYPQVRRTRKWLQERLEDTQRAGLGGQHLSRLLQLADYPPPPAYYVVELRPSPGMELRSVWSDCQVDSLVRGGVEWVITQEHPLPYSQVDAAFAAQLAEKAVLAARFDPFAEGARAALVYDPIDAYYVPLAGFGAVERPGPLIRIYQVGAKGL